MKILVDGRSLGTNPSGVGMYLYNFMASMAKMNDVTLYAASDIAVSPQMEELKRRGIRVIEMERRIGKGPGLVAYFRFVQEQIHSIHPDVFWEGNNLFINRMTNPYGKIVVTIHDVFPLTVKGCYGKLYPPYFQYGIANTLKYADAILYNSESTRKETERLFPAAKTKRHMTSYVIVPGTDGDTITDTGYFLYLGNLEKRKGTDLLLDAFLGYVQNGGERKLYLAGNIRDKDIRRKLMKVRRATDRVRYFGYVEEEKRRRLLAGCHCFVFPSRAEGFGIPVIEALQYEKPVITSDLEIFQEIAPGCVRTYSGGSYREETDFLSKALMEGKPQDSKKADFVVKRYGPDILSKAVIDFFRTMTSG